MTVIGKLKFVAALAALLLLAFAAGAVTLGRVRGAALIGRPLALTIPITLDGGEQDACVQGEVLQGDSRMSGVAVRTEPAPGGGQQVRITSNAVVEEPVVTVFLRVGCGQQVTRRYVVLAEHPDESASAPLVAPATPAPVPRPMPSQVAPPVLAAPRVAAPAPLRAESALRSARKNRPSVVRRAEPKAAAPDAHLKLEPLDLSIERSPTLQVTQRLESRESDGARRAQAAALWQALSTPPEDFIRQAQRIEAMEREMKALRDVVQQNTLALGQVGEQLQKARNERNWMSVAVTGFVALLLGALVYAFFRRRAVSADTTGARWWQHAPEGPETVLPGEAVAGDMPTTRQQTAAGSLPAEAEARPARIEPERQRERAAPAKTRSRGADTQMPEFLPSQASALRMVKAEELIDIEQQVAFFVSIGQTDHAIALLESHVHDHVETSPVAWLDLLKMYYRSGRRDDYERIRREFHALFNAQVPEFDAYQGSSAGLEEYRRALSRIIALWPSPRVLDVIEESIFRKPGTPGAEPFDLEAYRDLLLLFNVAKEIVGGGDGGESQPIMSFDEPRRTDFGATNIQPLSASVSAHSEPLPLSQVPPASANVGVDIDLAALEPPPDEGITFDFDLLPPKRL